MYLGAFVSFLYFLGEGALALICMGAKTLAKGLGMMGFGFGIWALQSLLGMAYQIYIRSANPSLNGIIAFSLISWVAMPVAILLLIAGLVTLIGDLRKRVGPEQALR